MLKVVWIFIILFASFTKQVLAYSIENKLLADVEAYCAYFSDKNNAKIKTLNAPDIVIRVQNSNNDYLLQNNLVSGLSKDLSDLGKAKYLKQLILDECQYYRLRKEASLQIQYTIPAVQQRSLDYKLKLISTAKNKVRVLLQTIQKRIDHHSDTLQSYYRVDSLLRKLENEERDIRLNLSQQHIPQMKFVPIKILLNQVWAAEKNRQVTLNQLEKQNNWSLDLIVGGQQSSTFNKNQAIQAYAGLFARYNLGSITSSQYMKKSEDRYMDWKHNQVDGLQNQLSNLMNSVMLMHSAEQERLLSLKRNYQKYHALSNKINHVVSQSAMLFKQQIDVDQIMIEIEINYVTYFISLLKKVT